MLRSLSTFLSDLRRDRRYPLRLPCRLELDGTDLGATVVQISLGGARIDLPPNSIAFLPGTLRAIRLPHLGAIPARERWRKGTEIGIAFRGRDTRRRIAAYFDDLGLEPDDAADLSPGG